MKWEDEARRAAIAGDWAEVARHLDRAGFTGCDRAHIHCQHCKEPIKAEAVKSAPDRLLCPPCFAERAKKIGIQAREFRDLLEQFAISVDANTRPLQDLASLLVRDDWNSYRNGGRSLLGLIPERVEPDRTFWPIEGNARFPVVEAPDLPPNRLVVVSQARTPILRPERFVSFDFADEYERAPEPEAMHGAADGFGGSDYGEGEGG